MNSCMSPPCAEGTMRVRPGPVYGPMVAPRAAGVLGDDDCPVVVDVGAGWPGDQQVAQRGEEAVAVVLREQRLRVESLPACPVDAVRSQKGSGVIFGPVDAVGICRHGVHAGFELDAQGQKKFAAAPPTSAFAAQ